MQPNLFYSNNLQDPANTASYVQIHEFNSSITLNSSFNHSLVLVLPTTLIESELRSVITVPQIVEEDDYFENNLAAPRTAFLREDFNDKPFYRNFENDLSTGSRGNIHEFTFTDYIDITYTYNSQNYRVQIGLPIKENIFNYYIDNVLQDPRNFNYYLAVSRSIDPISLDTLDNSLNVTSTIVDVTKNNSYLLLNDLSDAVILSTLPPVDIQIELYLSNNLISRTLTDLAFKYLPRLNFTDLTTNLLALSYQLYYLKSLRPNDYLTLTDSISSYLLDFIQEDYYLPPSVIAYNFGDNSIPDIYSYYESAKLVIALFNSYESEFSINSFRLVRELVLRLSASINVFDGLCNRTVSGNLVPLQAQDLPTTVLVSLALAKYLEFEYNSNIEYLLGIVTNSISSLFRDAQKLDAALPASDADKLDVLYYLALWAVANDITLLSYIDNRLNLYIASYQASTAEITLKTIYLVNLLNVNGYSSIDPINYQYSDLLTDYGQGSWGITEPNSYYTAWTYLIDNLINQSLEVEDYSSRYTQATTLLNYIYEKSKGYLPIDEPWFKRDNLNPIQGIIGTLLKAVSTTFYPLCYELICLYNSLDLTKAYGIGLDRWGRLFELDRFSINETDQSYRERLIAYSKLQSISSPEVSLYLDNLKTNDLTTITTFLPTEILYENATYVYTDFEDLISKAIDGVVELPDNTFFDLNKDLGVLNIVSYENLDINNMFLLLEERFNIVVLLKNTQSYVNEATILNRVS